MLGESWLAQILILPCVVRNVEEVDAPLVLLIEVVNELSKLLVVAILQQAILSSLLNLGSQFLRPILLDHLLHLLGLSCSLVDAAEFVLQLPGVLYHRVVSADRSRSVPPKYPHQSEHSYIMQRLSLPLVGSLLSQFPLLDEVWPHEVAEHIVKYPFRNQVVEYGLKLVSDGTV